MHYLDIKLGYIELFRISNSIHLQLISFKSMTHRNNNISSIVRVFILSW